MNFKLRSTLFLLGAILCLFLGWLFNRHADIGVLTSEEALATFETRTDTVLAQAKRQATSLEKEVLIGNHDFQNLLDHSNFPTFIFENDKLFFWSDNTTLSDFDNLHQLQEEQLVESRFGKFLVVKKVVEPDFIILICIPLDITYGINNRYLVSGLNPAIFGDLKAHIVVDLSAKLPEVYSPEGNYLYSILPDKTSQISPQRNIVAIFWFTLALVFAVLLLVEIRNKVQQKGYYTRSVGFFLVGIIALRFILLKFNFPTSLLRIGLFDPKYYAASFWSPSIGDLLLNALLILVIALEMVGLSRKKLESVEAAKIDPTKAVVIKYLALGGFYFLLYLLYHFYGSIYTNSLLVLDITQSLDFDAYKIMLLVGVLIHTAAFMAFSYVLMNVFFFLPEFTFRQSLLLLLSLAAIFIGTSFLETDHVFLVFAAFVFSAVVLVWEKRSHNSSLPNRHYVFGVLIIALSAWLGSMALYQHYHDQLQVYKSQFAKSFAQESDVVSEYLLEKVSGRIATDPLIRKKLTSPLGGLDFIEQKIIKYYLGTDFEKYEAEVMVFDAAGNRLRATDSVKTLGSLQNLLKESAQRTSYKNLFLLKSIGDYTSRKYLKLIPIRVAEKGTATVVVVLNPKKLTPSSVIPELLVDQKYVQPLQSKALSYAIYKDKQLRSSEGDYDYSYQFDPTWLDADKIFSTGRTGKKRDHFAVKQTDGTILVISTNKYLLRDIWSNFSFLFLLHLTVFLFALSSYSLVRGEFLSRFRTNFSTKIQLFLNFGILLPLLLISIAIGSLVTSSYKKDLTESYEKRGHLIQENLSNTLKNATDFTDKSKLEIILNNYSTLSETDINFYDASGKLQASSQPLIFEAGLLSKLINPQAFGAITQARKQNILLSEKAGTLDFSSLYLPLYSADKQHFRGFISLPFFDSEKELNLKLIELTTTILNIFTVIFIAFTALTYLAARVLTVPLNIITEKLKHTTLSEENERLTYASNDEIGLLVKSYNQMISKLEESKNELAVKEKEAAWREMARQVAHEIKNPLTPMKLSLQYLQKVIAEKRGNVEELISKTTQTLITNIDILSDIATSFSTFTTLPELKPERINLGTVLKRSIDLNFDPATARFEMHIPEETIEVWADQNLLTRTFNNLFLNALQAIPTGREPFIQVSLRKIAGNKAMISIRDNGTGIPAEVQDKVFIPNFSTKYSGSGIGLAVAKKGIESAGGQIWFETVENEGTTFFIELPLA